MNLPLRLELELDEAGIATARRIRSFLEGEGRKEGLIASLGIGLRVHVLRNDRANLEPRFTGEESLAMERIAAGRYRLDLSVDDPARFQYRYLALYDVPLFRRIGRTDRHVYSMIHVSELESAMPTSFGNRILPRGFSGGTHADRFGLSTVPSAKGPCAYPFRSLVIGADCRVTVCCVDDRFRLELGDIAKDSYSEIAEGARSRALRRAHAEGRFDKTPANAEGIPLCLLCHAWPTPRLTPAALACEAGFVAEAKALATRIAPNDPDRCDRMHPYLTVEVSSRCDLSCTYCSQKNASLTGRRDLSPAAFERFLATAAEAGATFENVNLFFRGESLLHPEFPRFVRAILATNRVRTMFRFLVLHTNAQQLDVTNRTILLDAWSQRDMPCCGNLVVSLDAATPETYRALRGGDLHHAEENVRAFVRERRSLGQFGPNMLLQFIVLPGNAGEAALFLERWGEILAAESGKPFRIVATLRDQPVRIDSDLLYLRVARTPGEGAQELRDDLSRKLYLDTVRRLGLVLEETSRV